MSKSTPIDNLPKNDSVNDDTETNMVNSILEEIQQEDERINDENEDSLKYTMDTSQIPPKINNNIPSKEMIQEATKDMFEKQNSEVAEILNNINEKQDIILSKEENKQKQDENKESDSNILKNTENNIEVMLNSMLDKLKLSLVIFVFFILLNLPILNKYLIKSIPKLSNNLGDLNILGVIIKGFILALIYFGFTFVF